MPIFVSHAVPDGPWSHWIARELQAAGHVVDLDPAGAGFAQRISAALSGGHLVLILFSAEHRGTDADWARIAAEPAPPGRLAVLRLDAADPPAPLRSSPCWSVHGLDEEDTLDLLLSLVGGPHPPRTGG